MIVIYFKLYY